MVTKTATRPTPRSSHSLPHTHSHTPSSRTPSKNMPSSSPAPRSAGSVSQSLPPNAPPLLQTPSTKDQVRTPSPNYFGLSIDSVGEPRDSGAGPRINWSPQTSSFQSIGASSPRHVPVDANPEFAAFRRQTEGNTAFNLGHGNLTHFASTPGAYMRPKADRRPSKSDENQDPPSPKSKQYTRYDTPDRMDIDGAGTKLHGSSQITPGATSFFDIPRQQSPANITPNPPTDRTTAFQLDHRHPRLSLPQNKADPPSPHLKQQGITNQRADTLPPSLEEGPILIAPVQLRDILDRLSQSQYLLLDLRVFPQFSTSRIQNALNLCIPTTLLKRPSFNLQKLQDTFTNESDKTRFSCWRSAKYIIVYDAFSDEKKDAISAMNTLKKFTDDGWTGHTYIVRGGYSAFSKQFPQMIDSRSTQDMQSSKINLSLGMGQGVAPVAGGCAMPATKNPANPFFSNIRQNQDLIGGVGQMDVKVPDELALETRKGLPTWLQKASAKDDKGKSVSDKFLNLELAEQSRMTKALASGVTYGTPAASSKDVQIAGIEKGSKNRYNNIWPFEHARVRLQGRSEGACDYVNASHIKASRSNKRYIASQGPLPATFEDFWSVIWDQDVRVIVMLTAESEGGQLKCHPYWSSKEYGSFKLNMLSEKKVSLDHKYHRASSDRHDSSSGRRRANTSAESTALRVDSPPTETPHAILRKFTLSHASHPFSPMREITQIHYSSWPDFGAPASPGQLLGLVDLSNAVQRGSSASAQPRRSSEPEPAQNTRPMLVHCSAGCGRTGTFCTIDSVIDMLKRQRQEHESGVTPMEGMSTGNDEKWEKKKLSGGWIFDEDLDLVEKTVEDFRGQRLSMVQSLRQYVLCYETVLEWFAQQNNGSAKPRERSGSDAGVEGRKSQH